MVARVDLPIEAKRGAVVPVRIAILHAMETGYRFDVNGRSIAKNVINTLTCRYLGEIIFRAEMGSGMSANPSVQFYFVAERSGDLEFDWLDDAGERGSHQAAVRVVA